jgi:serine/threonine protein kinase
VKDYSIELPLRLLREVILTMKMGWSPPTHLAEDPLALARFEREAKAIAALSHPNILGVFDIGIEGAVAYAVTERLGEDTLRAKLMGRALPARARPSITPRRWRKAWQQHMSLEEYFTDGFEP